jgi:hypothetical protein
MRQTIALMWLGIVSSFSFAKCSNQFYMCPMPVPYVCLPQEYLWQVVVIKTTMKIFARATPSSMTDT